MAVDMPRAYLVGALLECLCYGVLTTLFFICVGDLTIRRRTSTVNYVMLVSACIMWVGCTIHTGISAIERTLEAFIDNGSIPEGPLMYLLTENSSLFLASEGVFLIVNTAADLLLVYRCFLIWGNNFFVIIGPLMTITGSVVSACVALVKISELQPGQTLGIDLILNAGTALFSFSLCTNVTTTLLIAVRIMYLVKKNLAGLPRGHTRQYISIVGIVVESGALMALTQAIFLGLWASQNNVLWALYGVLDQIMAISPMLIIVRASSSSNSNQPEISVVTPVFQKPVISRGTNPSRPSERPYVLTEIETHRDPAANSARSYEEPDYGKKTPDPEWQG